MRWSGTNNGANDVNPDEERKQLAQVTGFMDELAVALIANSIYWTRHPRVENACANLVWRLKEYCEDTGRGRLTLRVMDSCIVHGGKPLLGASLSSPKVVYRIDELNGGGVDFDLGCTIKDFADLLDVLRARSGKHSDYLAANTQLKRTGCVKIRLLPPWSETGADALEERARNVTPEGDRLDATAMLDVPHRVYQGLVDCLQSTMMELSCGRSIEFGAVGSLVDGVLQTLDQDPRAMLNLARYEEYDAFTFGHSVRVCTLTLGLAKTITGDEQILKRIGVAALLHDVGKAKLPFELLHKRGRFTAEERLEMQKHPSLGAELLMEMEDPDPMAVAAAFGHHMTEDGRGYPETAVPVPHSTVTRILKICDCYEALTAVRPYKPAMSTARAYDMMLSMEGQFEPGLMRRFFVSNGIFPTGSRVRLNTGETATVASQSSRLDQPIVLLENAPDGEEIPHSERPRLDLSLLESHQQVRITTELTGS